MLHFTDCKCTASSGRGHAPIGVFERGILAGCEQIEGNGSNKLLAEPAQLSGFGRGLGAVADIQLIADVGDVLLYRLSRYD